MAKRKISKTPRKRRISKKINLNLFLIISIIVFVIALIPVYILLFFPISLNKHIKSDFIEYFNPLYYEDKENILVLKLENDKRDFETIEERFIEKYGISIYRDCVSNVIDKEIYKLYFYRNNYKFLEINPIYIYYDIINKDESADYDNKQIVEEKGKNEIEIKTDIEKIKHIEKSINKSDINKVVTNKIKENKIVEKKRFIEKKEQPNDTKVVLKKQSYNKKEHNRAYKVSIVIDDVGYNNGSIDSYLNLNMPLTFALIPDLPNSKKYYSMIAKRKGDIILHIPMEPDKGERFVEKNALLTSMDESSLRKDIKHMLNNYPYILGANNHMGSKAVSDRALMDILFSELSEKRLFWLDSYTTLESVSEEISKNYSMKHFRRDVFLDNQKDYNSIKKYFLELIKESKKKGYAIGIGHMQTAKLPKVLKDFYDQRENYNIEFVKLRDL